MEEMMGGELLDVAEGRDRVRWTFSVTRLFLWIKGIIEDG
jgi:hypothetical protein